MSVKAVIVWVVGLLTFVPWGIYYLIFEAPRDQYALLITSILFWIFGFWSVVGPLLMAIKARRVLRALESAGSQHRLTEVLKSPDTKEVAIDLIATEHRLPRFLSAWIYTHLLKRLSVSEGRHPDHRAPMN